MILAILSITFIEKRDCCLAETVVQNFGDFLGDNPRKSSKFRRYQAESVCTIGMDVKTASWNRNDRKEYAAMALYTLQGMAEQLPAAIAIGAFPQIQPHNHCAATYKVAG